MAANIEDRNTGQGTKGNKCQKLFRENILLVLLICLIILGIIVGTLLIFVIPVLLKIEARPYRLPTDVVPYEYELEIKPYIIPDNFEFEGQVEIYMACVRKTDLIVLHSRNLTIDEDSVKVTSVDEGGDIKVLLINYDTSNDLLVLRLLEDLKERRKYRIYIKYKGPLEPGNNGFYISTYEDDEKSIHYVASTQFEPVRARAAFPCFDEPEFKSTFNITLVRWKNMTTLSNMPRLRTEDRGENWKADIFEKSMRMSTYLVAFVFCDYVGRTKGKITVWSPEHRKDNSEFALNVSIKALQFFEGKLEIPYPGPKLDMVPVTSTTGSAMENWGLIIYEESVLLTRKDKKDDDENLSEIVATVAHEIAHQWFGNLVTPKWWSDLWLSEGITSYMEDLAKVEILPELSQIDPTIEKIYGAVIDDCTKAGPIWESVNSSNGADRKFGGVTYEKGGMIARMAHQILGDEVFWKGMRRYLTSNAYENVEEVDLWRYLTAAQNPGAERLDVAEIMHSWTHVSGIPIVNVHRDYNRRTVTVSQRSCKSNMKEHENDLWNIPIIIESKYAVNLLNKITWLKKKNMIIEGMPDEDEWIVVNGDSTGYYLVNYDRKNWNLISHQLRSNHEIFEPTERYKFIKELIELERTSYTEIDLVLQHFIYLKEEKEKSVLWNTITPIAGCWKLLNENEYYELLREFIIYIWKDIYERYGWKEAENDASMGFTDAMESYRITSILCKLKYSPCVEEAVVRFSTFREKETVVDEDYFELDFLTLCTVVGNSSYEEWKSIKETHFSKEGYNLSSVLKCSNDAAIVRGELPNLFDDTEGNVAWLIKALAGNTVGFNEIMNFYDKHFEKLMEKGFVVKEWHKDWINILVIKVSRIEQFTETFSKHLESMSGSNAENLEIFLDLLQKKVPVLEKKTRTLKKWLEGKPWRQSG